MYDQQKASFKRRPTARLNVPSELYSPIVPRLLRSLGLAEPEVEWQSPENLGPLVRKLLSSLRVSDYPIDGGTRRCSGQRGDAERLSEKGEQLYYCDM